MKSKIIIVFIYLLIIHSISFAQKTRYLPFGLGASYQSVQDLGMSPLIYRGAAFNLTFGYFEEKENYIDRNLVLLHVGGMMNKQQESFSSTLLRGDYSYTHVRKATTFFDDQIDYFLGGQIIVSANSRINGRLTNIGFGYDFSQSIGVSNWARYKFQLFERDFTIDANVNIPVLTFMMRPNYTSIGDFTNPDANEAKELFRRGKLVSLGKFIRFSNLFHLSYHLKNGNAFMLTYNWDYYSYNQVNKVKAAYHAVYITTLFNL